MVLNKALPFKIPKTTSASLILQEDLEPYFYDKLHQHEEYQLTVILEGTGTVVHGEFVGSFDVGDVLLIGSNVPHVFRCDESHYREHKKAHAISVFFHQDQMNKLMAGFSEFKGIEGFMNRANLGGQAFGEFKEKAGQRIKDLYQASEFDRLLQFLQLLNDLSGNKEWKSLLEQSARHVKEQDGKRLNDIFSFTLSNYQRQIAVDEVADIAHMNKSSFCRYFKQHTRKSYVDFLNEYRIQKASSELANPDKSVAQIAFEVGFNNLSNFNRQFKRIKEVTPRDYRDRLSNYN